MLPHMCQLPHVSSTFYQTTRREAPWLGKCVPNSTTARVFYAAAEAHPGEVRASNLGRRRGEEMGFCHHPFFNYQTARRGEEATLLPLSLRTLTTYRERERAMEVLLQDCTGPSARACYQTVRRLSSLSLSNPDDDDDDGCCCCFF